MYPFLIREKKRYSKRVSCCAFIAISAAIICLFGVNGLMGCLRNKQKCLWKVSCGAHGPPGATRQGMWIRGGETTTNVLCYCIAAFADMQSELCVDILIHFRFLMVCDTKVYH